MKLVIFLPLIILQSVPIIFVVIGVMRYIKNRKISDLIIFVVGILIIIIEVIGADYVYQAINNIQS